MNQGVTPTGPNYAAIDAVNFGGSEECSGIPQSPYLGVEEMMVLLSTRLGKLDDEVKVMMADQKKRIEQRSAIKDFENAMGEFQPPKNDAEYQKMRTNMEKAINSLPEGDPVRSDLEQQLSGLDGANRACSVTMTTPSTETQGVVEGIVSYVPRSKDAWVADKQEIANMAENLGDNAEMEMLTLQSHMTKRTTLVQLTTNIVQKLEAAPDMIAKNI
ncbi:MAG: hypothetical protein H6718_08125 [Polyangiaceae bacterium]|nr:hypothetical protein [Polyangiaceae bacterium]